MTRFAYSGSLILLLVANVTAFSPIPRINKNNNHINHLHKLVTEKVATVALSGLILASTLFPLSPSSIESAHAESRLIGEIAGSGIVFKDTLNIEAFSDPKVKGVELYISNFERPLNEKLSKDFFSDPSFAAVGCAKVGPISIADNIARGKQGEEVFEEKRSLLFKQLRVQRVYDEETNTMVYVSFNTRLNKGDDANKSRYKSSICAVNLN